MAKTGDQDGLKRQFTSLLMQWNRGQNQREMPWKGEKDPYRVWLSEIILQQTRVEQGLSYYQRFITNYPTIEHLANANDQQVFKDWEGLGYYSRCRNLLATARFISYQLKGEFPRTYEQIKALKGIGPYTAAAIASFAFNLPYAVLDGNVFRVLSRVFGITISTSTGEGKKYFTTLANEVLDKNNPGKYNQAIMDFGATICKPLAAGCDECVLSKICFARKNNMVGSLPVKDKKAPLRKRHFYYLVIEHCGKIAIRQREEKDIWRHLHEFVLVEDGNEKPVKEIVETAVKNGVIDKKDWVLISESAVFKQQLTHQLVTAKFIRLKVGKKPVNGFQWVSKRDLRQYAFPRLINSFLESCNGELK